MAESVTLTPKQLQDMLAAVLAQSQQLNPLEQRKLDEEMKKEHRRNLLMVELGKQEEERERRRKFGCSHKRDPRTGDAVGKDMPGEWCTGGQAFQNGLAMMICLRCATPWLFRPTPNYYNDILQSGLLKQPPPPESQLYCMGCLELQRECICEQLRAEQNKVA